MGIVSGLSGFFTVKNVLWFMSLLQSKFTPPRKTFRVMWTMSYVLMGISSFLVWRQERDLQSPTLIVYALQLAINALYCPLFFGLKRLDIALADIILLDTVLVYCIFLFSQISVLAAALMLPYLAWTIFSTALNADFYRLSVGKGKILFSSPLTTLVITSTNPLWIPRKQRIRICFIHPFLTHLRFPKLRLLSFLSPPNSNLWDPPRLLFGSDSDKPRSLCTCSSLICRIIMKYIIVYLM